MSFDFERIIQSKRALRERLAARPIVEKLRMLDVLRARTLALRSATVVGGPIVQEKPAPYKKRKAT